MRQAATEVQGVAEALGIALPFADAAAGGIGGARFR